MKKFTLKIICLGLIAVTIYSCSKSDDTIVTPGSSADTATNFKYPYTINSNWFFTTTPNYAFYPDSIRRYISGIDSSIEVGYAVWKNDTVINGINARVLRTNHTSSNHAYNTTECYVQTDTGLVNISYTESPSFGPFRPNPDYKFVYNDKQYYSIEEFKSKEFNGSLANIDSVSAPINCIKYPIVTNNEWYFRKISALQIQKKKYLNYVQVQTSAGVYNCIPLQLGNYQGNVRDTNFIQTDYFSKIGMVKRSRKFKNIAFYYMGNIIGYFDVGEEVVLNSASIVP